jgi:anthranilate/para-aminobenzoate synthase component I
MPSDRLEEFLSRPAETRPVALEGRWLDGVPEDCWVAMDPVSVLEGSGDAFGELPQWFDRHARKYPDGAAVGFLSYELARHLESLPLPTYRSLPDVCFAYYPRVERLRGGATRAPGPREAVRVDSGVDFKTYRNAVERIRSYIAAGDIYQANLTIPFCAELGDEPAESIYLRMRGSGAAFRAFLKTPKRTILSNSPERFFRVTGNRILASPIKGTIARDGHDDQRSQAALLASEKDRAENLMIVDLLRNDLGRICDYASIRARLWETEVLPQLVHLVSHIEGTLRPGTGILEILGALFPCGSITGAPKIRAMEILSEIEQAPRGVSMGAIGIIRSPGDRDRCRMDFNVAIRTMIIEEGKALFNVGGGIVYDSDPVAEYAEVMLKAQPLFDALGAQKPQAPTLLPPNPKPIHQHGFPHIP